MKIELDAPNLGKLEKNYLNKTIDTGYVSTFGPFILEFEKKFARYLSVKNAVSTQSGTAALHISLYELGVGLGDEVIVPDLTFAATVNPIIYTGAKPVFVDVDIKTWNISPENIERAVTKRTKAVIPVHLFGNPCDMDKLMKIAKRHNFFIIEDATESLGAKYKGKYTGTFGELGAFSFNGNKVITTGGGGMVAGIQEKRLGHIKFLVNQARDETNEYYYPEIGFNYRMTNIEAALGLAQLQRLDGFLNKKKEFNAIYKEELKKIDFIIFQEEYEGAQSSFWSTCIFFEKKIDIIALQKKMKRKGIPARRIFMPVTESPPYKIYKNSDNKNSYRIYERSLCLPNSTLNSKDDIFYVCKTIKSLV